MLKRLFCKHEWKLIDIYTGNFNFGIKDYTYGCDKCGTITERMGEHAANVWKFERKYKGESIIEEAD